MHENLNNAPCAGQYSVHTMNTDVYIMCEVPTTVNLMKVACLMLTHMSDIFQINLMQFLILNKKDLFKKKMWLSAGMSLIC